METKFSAMTEQNTHKISFLVALISEFGRRFGVTDRQSYEYISSCGGIDMFLQNYDILHTLSFADMVEGMAAFCERKGGKLAV